MSIDKPFAITLDKNTSLANHTGSWRSKRPVYVDRLPPCNATCPAGENIQNWLFHAESGNYEAAWRSLTENNPLPAIMGRVCYHPCEGACNRGQLDEAVGINAVERFLGDEALKQGWAFAKPAVESGKRVLVVGSGPAGLSATYHLRRMGHGVTIVEAETAAGGMMRYGIPRYRLPRQVLDAEVQRILDMGVELRLDTRVDDVLAMQAAEGFDAVFLGIGAGIAKRAYIPAGDASHITDAVSVLHEVEDSQPLLGRKVVIYGGGNTAIDVARTAKRLGAEESIIVYRRTRDKMPAHDFEVTEALEEGVKLKWLSTITEAGEGSITIEKMALDAKGFPQPTGEFETLPADSVVLALGQNVEQTLLEHIPNLEMKWDSVQTDAVMMTSHDGVFAGGDMVAGSERTVTVAVGHGKKAARAIDAWLRGELYQPAPKHEPATFERLNTWYYADAEKTVRPVLDIIRRQSTFDEVVGGLDESNALFEARRCLSCGNCFECDNCYGVCPDSAVIKLGAGKRFVFNYDYCKGCGLCAEECPCGAIVVELEDK
ncbi:MAG: NAD(P)-binding protein [Candidatus Thiothrix putei]|uniref:NAD(P)-binding protein n=1 Tax=Candidatus Thiothrix putei TaxID=3080811 RepID=A0AA95KPR4_9GAMM|nr:MAG: NAD(P)-binding protein [Candidatus Thiothrix putei]